MADRAAKDALFEALASVAKALGNGHRAEIIDVLAQGERSVEDLAAEIGQSVANTSHHLRSLARAGVLTTRRDGTRVFYRLASARVADLWAAMRDVAAAHVADLDQLARAYLGSPDGVEEISRDELAQRLACPRRHRARRPPHSRVRSRPRTRRPLRSDHRVATPSPRTPHRRRHRRVLPRPLLRLRQRRGQTTPQTRLPRPTPPRRLPRMATGRPPRRFRHLIRNRDRMVSDSGGT